MPTDGLSYASRSVLTCRRLRSRPAPPTPNPITSRLLGSGRGTDVTSTLTLSTETPTPSLLFPWSFALNADGHEPWQKRVVEGQIGPIKGEFSQVRERQILERVPISGNRLSEPNTLYSF